MGIAHAPSRSRNLSWRGWVQGLRALLRGEGLLRPSDKLEVPELRPIAATCAR